MLFGQVSSFGTVSETRLPNGSGVDSGVDSDDKVEYVRRVSDPKVDPSQVKR